MVECSSRWKFTISGVAHARVVEVHRWKVQRNETHVRRCCNWRRGSEKRFHLRFLTLISSPQLRCRRCATHQAIAEKMWNCEESVNESIESWASRSSTTKEKKLLSVHVRNFNWSPKFKRRLCAFRCGPFTDVNRRDKSSIGWDSSPEVASIVIETEAKEKYREDPKLLFSDAIDENFSNN